MHQQALVEINTNNVPVLTEKRDDGKIFLEGIASEAGVRNGNGRVYPVEVMRRAVADVQSKIQEGAFNGELDHPEFGYRGTLARTAIRFTDLFMEGNLVKFKAQLLETPDGQTLKALLDGGVKVGMSTRGAGSLKMQETADGEIPVVDDDFELFGIDAVDIPSSAVGIMRIQESIEAKINEVKGFTQMAQPKEIKTVADLREAHEVLVVQIEESAKTAALAPLEAEKAALEARVTQLESELAEANKSVNAMTEVRKQVLGEKVADTKDDNIVLAKLEALTTKLETVEAALTESKAEIKRRDERAAVEVQLTEAYEVEVKGDALETVLRKHVKPLAFESVDALKAKLNEYRTVFADVKTVIPSDEGKEKGKGVVEESTDDKDKSALNEVEMQERILSGLAL